MTAVLLAAALAALAPSRAARAEGTFDWVGVSQGRVMTRDDCRWPDTSVWVEVTGEGDCLRYFASGLAPTNPSVMLFLHGDRAADTYRANSESKLAEDAEKRSGELGVPYVWLSRPGIFGSSGNYLKNRRSMREANLVDAAIDAIKARYGIAKFDLVGQSSGGRLVGILLSLRDDVRCAVTTSGGLAQRKLFDLMGWEWKRFIVDPIALVERIPADPKRRIILIGDARDVQVPFEIQRLYHAALVRVGIPVELIALDGKGAGKNHHDLAPVGVQVAAWCGAGVAEAEIRARAPSIRNP